MSAAALRFQVGARILFSIPQRLQRVAVSLDEAVAGKVPKVPRLAGSQNGFLITSLPETLADQMVEQGFFHAVRQRYTRYYVTFEHLRYDQWLAGLSGNARSGLRRKQKKLAQHLDGITIRSFRSPDEMAEFHALARPVAAVTYQERLMGMGLPDGPEFVAEMRALAVEDRARAWLMTLGGRAVAYLWCSAEGEALRYDYVGHDPAYAELSPGTVLHAAAFEELFAEQRFKRFDFTEGEGQHKRQFATDGVACVDLLLLRDTVANRAAVGAVEAFDRAVSVAKRLGERPAFATLARRVRRA